MEDHWSCLLMYKAFPIANKFAVLLYSPLIPTAQLFTTTKMRQTRAGNGINQSKITPNCRDVWHVNQKVNSSDTKQFFLVTIYDTYQGVPWRRGRLEEAFRVPTALSPIGTRKLEQFSFDLKKWFPWVLLACFISLKVKESFPGCQRNPGRKRCRAIVKKVAQFSSTMLWKITFSAEKPFCVR